MPLKQFVAATHDTRPVDRSLEYHRRGRPVLLGTVVDQHLIDQVAGVLSTVTWLWRVHVTPRKPRGAGSCMSSEEAGQSRSRNACAS